MLIDRVVMIHIELHHCDNGWNSGIKAPDTPSSFMRRKARLGVAVFQQQIKKESPCASGSLRIASSIKMQIRCDQPHCIRDGSASGAQTLFKQAKKIKFIVEKSVCITRWIRRYVPRYSHQGRLGLREICAQAMAFALA